VAEPAQCESSVATMSDGGLRRIVRPAEPVTEGRLLSPHRVRVRWSVPQRPSACTATELEIAVRLKPPLTIWKQSVKLSAERRSGSTVLEIPDFATPTAEGIAATLLPSGTRSSVHRFHVTRPLSLPPDPPAPALPVTAPAGAPVACSGQAVTISDSTNDVLAYAPGSPPAPTRMTAALRRADITQAKVIIVGRKLCAWITFAQPPPVEDFHLSISLRDAHNTYCCTGLLFRRDRGEPEVGASNGQGTIKAVKDAGAVVKGSTVVITGTFASPAQWNGRYRRLLPAQDVGWSITSAFYPRTYGPYYGDWLPRESPVNQPLIRQHDGATVTPLPRR
jgi:hypothetical protein